MDLQGSLVDTNLRIYPSNNLIAFFKSLSIDDVPENIIKFMDGKKTEVKQKLIKDESKTVPIYLDSKDIENLHIIRSSFTEESDNLSQEDVTIEGKNTRDSDTESNDNTSLVNSEVKSKKSNKANNESNEKTKKTDKYCKQNKSDNEENKLYLLTSDIDWLYVHLQKQRNAGEKNVPYLHELLEGTQIETPGNEILKRNPVLEARCVKLRAQQEARDYRKMTKSVDNVRMRFPEDSVSYQLKQVNRQLIAIGQFIISIFAGFLFGFKGVEWTIGPLDFGFKLLLGVMCALIIALAEIYFLAKKLNEELSIPETVQLGGPAIFADQEKYPQNLTQKTAIEKEHQE